MLALMSLSMSTPMPMKVLMMLTGTHVRLQMAARVRLPAKSCSPQM
jgi:hypothetical protein